MSQDLLFRILGDDTSHARALARSEANQRRYDTAIMRARAEMDADFAKRDAANEAAQKRTQDRLAGVGRAAIGVGVAAGAGVAAAISAFANFDQAMSEVQAATHASAQTMSQLGDAATAAGATTAFSAVEAAAGIEELSKAGLSSSEIMGGALAGALDLAAAGGLGVAEAAETTATALGVFNLEGSQAGHVADLLAAGAGKAQGSVSDIGAALNQSALVANQFGLSIEETTGSLALFASEGLIGSDAGTAFKTMLQALGAPTAEAKAKMDELGISVYDAQGEFVGMESVAGQLQERMGGLDDATRNAALRTIFGSDAIRAANALYEAGADGVAEWTAKVDDSGYAAETAALRMDNLKGDLEKLSGALETALIGLGESGDGPMRSLVQNLTDLVDGFAELPPAAQTTLLAAGAVTAALGIVGGSALVLIPKIAATRLALTELGVTSAGTATALKALSVAGGVVVAAFAADWGIDKITEWNDTRVSVDGLSEDLLRLGETGEASGELLDVFGSNLEGLGDLLARSPEGFNHWIDAAEGNYESLERIDDALVALVEGGRADEAAAIFDEIAGAAARQGQSLENTTKHLSGYADAATVAGTGIGSTRRKFLDAADAIRFQKEEIERLPGAYAELPPAAGAAADSQIVSAGLAKEALAAELAEIDTLVDAYNSLNEINMGVGESEAARQQAIDDLATTVGRLTGAVDENGQAIDTSNMTIGDIIATYGSLDEALNDNLTNFDLNTQAGRDLQDSVYGIAKADVLAAEKAREYAVAHGTDARDANEAFAASLDVSRANLSLTLQEMGIGKDAADALALSVIGIPDVKTTKMKADDEDAKRKVEAQEERLRLLAVARETKLNADPAGILEGTGIAQTALDGLHDKTVSVDVVINYSINGMEGVMYGPQGPSGAEGNRSSGSSSSAGAPLGGSAPGSRSASPAWAGAMANTMSMPAAAHSGSGAAGASGARGSGAANAGAPTIHLESHTHYPYRSATSDDPSRLLEKVSRLGLGGYDAGQLVQGR